MTALPTNAAITYDPGDAAGPWTAAVKQLYDFVSEGIAAQAPTMLTIAAGVVTPTRGAHLVDTEAAAAADDLTNLSTASIADGRWLIIRPVSAARVVTVKHLAGGAGQVSLLTGVDCVFSSAADFLVLERSGADWRELFRRVGQATTTAYGLVELATAAEVQAGTDPDRAVTPAGLASLTGNTSRAGLLQVASTAEADAGTDTAKSMTAALVARRIGFAMPTGSILPYAGSSAPTGFLLCDGAAVSRTTYAALFAIIGTTYGTGDGSTTFNVPDLKGRSPMGAGAGSGLTNRTLATKTGAETHTLSISEMPQHGHPFRYRNSTSAGGTDYLVLNSGGTGIVDSPAWNGTTDATAGHQIGGTGGGGAHNNVHPVLVVNFLIKT